MAFIKQKQNKRYNYKPRFYDGEGSPFEMKHKFDESRSTLDSAGSVKHKFLKALNESRNSADKTVNKRVLLIIAILILIFLFIIDFDLNIFFPQL